jgi:NADPH-dependent 2,4-dienoyl-CoA reductase/sulfur reductase-like enzyme
MVKSGLSVRGARIVVAGSGPLLLAVAAGLRRAGASVGGVFEQASWERLVHFTRMLSAHPAKLVEAAEYRLRLLDTPCRTGWWVSRADGRQRLESVTVTNGSEQRELACEYLACSFHLVPNLELPQLLGCRIDGNCVTVGETQETSVEGIFCAGEPTGVGGLDKALVEGQIAGLAAAGRAIEAARFFAARDQARGFARALDDAFALRDELRALAAPETVVCRCEDVTYAELQGCPSGRAARLHTRCGMGPCQARICGPAAEFLFGWSPAAVRPPLYPARIATLAASAETNSASTDP